MERRGRAVVAGVATAGVLWGAVAYNILWGYTSIVVTRRFVQSLAGLLALLPVRLVLWGIRLVEDRVVHHPFDFSANHVWIGYVAAATGALLATVPFLLARAAVRRWRGRPPVSPPGGPGRSSPASAPPAPAPP